MIDYDSFYELIDIDESEKEAAKEYVGYRGLIEHIYMANYLSSFIADRKPTYKEIATSFRYDKRIRRIIYKYIGLLEEQYRSFICNNFNSPKENGIKTQLSLYEFCNSSLFSGITNIIWKLDSSKKSVLFEGKNHLKKNIEALVGLRNAVSHNRTLINYNDFKEVTLQNGEVGRSLLINIKNLHYFLPSSVAGSFTKEINAAARLGEKKRHNQTEWRLPPFIIIKL